jgi:hypothetical protein
MSSNIQGGIKMANNCYFNARIAGKTSDVDRVCEFIKDHYYDSCEFTEVPDENYETNITISGDVKWSLASAWNTKMYTEFMQTIGKLPEQSKGYTLLFDALRRMTDAPSILDYKGDYILEAFSEECGMGFQEHYIIKDGELLVDDCRLFCEDFDEEKEESHPTGGYKRWELDFDINKDIPEWNGELR